MKLYVCPMHLEVTSKKPGICPKCGMSLVLESEIHETKNDAGGSYKPLLIIVSLILITCIAISVKSFLLGQFSLTEFISNFMIGFFLVFSGFKFLDLNGFAEGYRTYDLLAQKWSGYGFIYPFIELFFGIMMILNPALREILFLEIIVMTFGGVGVLIKILKREKFQCACLGTLLKVPLTYVTLIEDFGMAALAGLLLIIR